MDGTVKSASDDFTFTDYNDAGDFTFDTLTTYVDESVRVLKFSITRSQSDHPSPAILTITPRGWTAEDTTRTGISNLIFGGNYYLDVKDGVPFARPPLSGTAEDGWHSGTTIELVFPENVFKKEFTFHLAGDTRTPEVVREGYASDGAILLDITDINADHAGYDPNEGSGVPTTILVEAPCAKGSSYCKSIADSIITDTECFKLGLQYFGPDDGSAGDKAGLCYDDACSGEFSPASDYPECHSPALGVAADCTAARTKCATLATAQNSAGDDVFGWAKHIAASECYANKPKNKCFYAGDNLEQVLHSKESLDTSYACQFMKTAERIAAGCAQHATKITTLISGYNRNEKGKGCLDPVLKASIKSYREGQGRPDQICYDDE